MLHLVAEAAVELTLRNAFLTPLFSAGMYPQMDEAAALRALEATYEAYGKGRGAHGKKQNKALTGIVVLKEYFYPLSFLSLLFSLSLFYSILFSSFLSNPQNWAFFFLSFFLKK